MINNSIVKREKQHRWENIPDELKVVSQWVGWRWGKQKVNRKRDKKPINPHTGALASVSNTATWATFSEAVGAVEHGTADGIGFVFTDGDSFVGIDLDGPRDPTTGDVEHWALEIVECFPSAYWEISPSGTGLHGIMRGKLPTGGRVSGQIEVYERGRFFTMTGAFYAGEQFQIGQYTIELAEWHAEVFGAQHTNGTHHAAAQRRTQQITQEVIDALGYILAGDYHVWLRVGMALHSTGSQEAFSVWDAWSATCAEKYEPGECEKRWRSFSSDRAHAVGIGTIISLAKETGWTPASKTDVPLPPEVLVPDYADVPLPPEDGVVFQNDAREDVDDNASHARRAEWPPMDAAAFLGLAGEIVKAIDAYTEADPVATLLNILTAFGNCLNAGPHCTVQHDQHPARLFVVQVGDTSKGRKGTGWSTPRYMFSLADPDWAEKRLKGGLSSGEGLIYAVRDPVFKTEAVKEKGKYTGEYVTICEDPGEDDKRLLVIEPEFASVLTVADRERNTLSAILRQAWDGQTLSPMTKNNRIKATGAHISIIGHITKQELLARLDDTSKANGFANRFLWVLVKRSKELPEGGSVPDEELQPLIDRLREVITFSRTISEVQRDDEAKAIWAAIYHDLSEGKPGLLGAVLGRAEAQVLRLSLIYALLDCSGVIRAEHLKAALAMWEYCERSALLIFGESLGDPTADRILEALRTAGDAGMSEKQVYDLFTGHKTTTERLRALRLLQQLGWARSETQETGGRPKTLWYAPKRKKSWAAIWIPLSNLNRSSAETSQRTCPGPVGTASGHW